MRPPLLLSATTQRKQSALIGRNFTSRSWARDTSASRFKAISSRPDQVMRTPRLTVRHTLLDAAHMLVLLQDPLRTHRLRLCASERVSWCQHCRILGQYGCQHRMSVLTKHPQMTQRQGLQVPGLCYLLCCCASWIGCGLLQACHAHKSIRSNPAAFLCTFPPSLSKPSTLEYAPLHVTLSCSMLPPAHAQPVLSLRMLPTCHLHARMTV